MTATGQNILINRLSSIGDVVFALPALALLRRERPRARISWVVEDRAADLLRDHPQLDEVIVMPRRQWRRRRAEGASRFAVLAEMRRFGRELAAREFDLTLDFQGNLKSGLVTRASRAPLRIGFHRRETKEPNWLFTNRRVDLGGAVMHRIDRDLRLLGALDIAAEYLPPTLAFGADDRAPVDDFLRDLEPGGPLVVINPGTSTWFESKRWDLDYWASLADWLVTTRGARIVINWGPDEVELVRRLTTLTRTPVRLGPDLGDMRQVAYLMSRADLVIGSDTGPVHVASAQGRPTIILFGPYDPRLYHPYGHPERALYARVPCSPCRYRGCPEVDCMRLIAPAMVARVVDAVLDGRPLPMPDLSPLKTVPI